MILVVKKFLQFSSKLCKVINVNMYGSYAKLLYALLISAIKIYTQFMLEDKELRLNFTFQNS